MINVIILEDEKQASDKLRSYLARFSSERGIVFNVTVYDNAVSMLEVYKADADIIFVDIQMPLMNGMDAAHLVRERDEKVILVFVTNLAQYAIKGYEVGAHDFVLKPVRYEAFAMKLERLCHIVGHSDNDRTLVFAGKDKMRRVNAEEILYMEVVNHDITVHMASGEFRVRGTLSSMREKLEGRHFVMCNSCYLVNLAYVSGVDGDIVVVGGHRLRISQPKRKAFLQEVAKYLGGSV